MTALCVHEIADRFWADVGEEPMSFPRELADVACWAIPVEVFELPNLSVGAINRRLAERQVEHRLAISDRPLRACVLAHEGNGLLFVDGSDPDDERRFSVAHEIAHYLIEYAAPRRLARARLGDGILTVLDGRRAASWEERLGAVLGGVSLAVRVHLMERTPDHQVPGRDVAQAEQCADEPGFELLAPYDAVRAALPPGAPMHHVETVLRQQFGLPVAPAGICYPLSYQIEGLLEGADYDLGTTTATVTPEGERLTLRAWMARFRDEVAAKVAVGVYRASEVAPARVFYASVDRAHKAARIVLADSLLQPHRGFPMLIDVADHVCTATMGPDTLAGPIQAAYTLAGVPLRHLGERRTRGR